MSNQNKQLIFGREQKCRHSVKSVEEHENIFANQNKTFD